MVFNVTMATFRMTPLMYKFANMSWMMDEFIYWPKPYLLLSAICDETWSWMIEI